MDLYIYYRVAVEQAKQFSEAAAAMQAMLSRQHHIATALKRRPDVKEGHHTWMEVYPGVPESFAQTVAQAVADTGIASLIAGQRHAEWFISESASESASKSISEFSATGSPCA